MVVDVLVAHASFLEVRGVIGVPYGRWGETVKGLVVVPGAEVAEAELMEWCRDRLAHHTCPTSIELARTATGKLQKFKLRAPSWEGRERQVN